MRFMLWVVMGGLLAGCASGHRDFETTGSGPSFDAQDCKGKAAGGNREECVILVDVVLTNAGCDVVVHVDQNEVDFDRGASNKWVIWQIDKNPGGYRFAPKGIVFKKQNDNFRNDKSSPNGLGFRWKNRNGSDDAGEYPYTVAVQHLSGKPRCEHDPLIRNR
jgi:hypothetical protein